MVKSKRNEGFIKRFEKFPNTQDGQRKIDPMAYRSFLMKKKSKTEHKILKTIIQENYLEIKKT